MYFDVSWCQYLKNLGYFSFIAGTVTTVTLMSMDLVRRLLSGELFCCAKLRKIKCILAIARNAIAQQWACLSLNRWKKNYRADWSTDDDKQQLDPKMGGLIRRELKKPFASDAGTVNPCLYSVNVTGNCFK